jgi:hypothetical protein
MKAAAKKVVAATVKAINRYARFVAPDGSTALVFLREQKNGTFNTGITVKQPKQRAKTGCSAKHTDLAAADAAFTHLLSVPVANDYTPKVKKVRTPKAPAFTEADFPKPKPAAPAADKQAEKAALKFPKSAKK